MEGKSIFTIVRHRYSWWTSVGTTVRPYEEILEIKNPPLGKCGIVMHSVGPNGEHRFTEWDSLEKACEVWDKTHHINDSNYMHELRQGYMRYVYCYDAKPWFCGVEGDTIVEDFVAPPGQLF